MSLRFSMMAAAMLTCITIASANAETAPADMPKGKYMLDKAHASLVWKVSHLGLSDYTARFTDFDATLDYNPGNVEKSSLSAVVNVGSLKTDHPDASEKDFDKKLTTSKDWFNNSEYKTITFTSTSIKRTGDNTADVMGDLTMLGVTKPATLNVTFNKAMAQQPFSKKPTLGFSATSTIKRSEWGFDTYVPQIGDEVTLLIEAELAHGEK